MRRYVSFVLYRATGILLILGGLSLTCLGNDFPSGRKGDEIIRVPYQFTNGFMVVSVRIDDRIPLQFIFDTGAEHTLLFDKQITDLLGLSYIRQIQVYGADYQDMVNAYLTSVIQLNIRNVPVAPSPLLVLDNHSLDLSSVVGVQVHGILSANHFRGFIIKLDYKREEIVLYPRSQFKPKKLKLKEFSMIVEKQKPYVLSDLHLTNGTTLKVKLLLDTGANLGLLLHQNTHESLVIPAQTVSGEMGFGLGGSLEGYLGRVGYFTMGKDTLRDLVTFFHDLTTMNDSIFSPNRNGIIGSSILSRYFLYLDMQKEILYMKARKIKKNRFQYDKSGADLTKSGIGFKQVYARAVIQNSPAWNGGLRPGDEVISINGRKVRFFELEELSRILRKKEGKRIKMTIIQQGEQKKILFYLKTYI